MADVPPRHDPSIGTQVTDEGSILMLDDQEDLAPAGHHLDDFDDLDDEEEPTIVQSLEEEPPRQSEKSSTGLDRHEDQGITEIGEDDVDDDEVMEDEPGEEDGEGPGLDDGSDLGSLFNDDAAEENLEVTAEDQASGNQMEDIQGVSHGQGEHQVTTRTPSVGRTLSIARAPSIARTPSVTKTPEPRERTSTPQNRAADDGEEGDSLFMPYQRIPSQTPSFPTRPPAAPHGPIRPATPGPSTRPPSRMAPPPAPDARPMGKPPRGLFEKIRNMQQKKQQERLATSTAAPHAAQPSSSRPSYLDEILSLRPGGQQSVDATVSADTDDDKADKAACAKFNKDKSHYEELKRKNGGKLSFADEIMWMKINAAEETRLRKRKRDMQMEMEANGGGSEIFTAPSMSGNSGGYNSQGSDLDASSARRTPASSPAYSDRVFQSFQDAELQSMQVALQAAGDAPRSKKRKGARMPDEGNDISSGKGRGGPKGSKSKKSGTRKSVKEKKDVEKASRMKSSLLNSDVFRQQANEDAPEQPTFTSRNKADALKELIASVPIEHQKTAKDDTTALLRATKDFDGRGSCKADGNGMWKVKGMQTSLKHYQVMGTAFMRRRENDEHEPRGGLMADQMGLGKTLMTLANIVNGRGNRDEECKTTLLVASPALITQWQREIELHTDCGLNFMRYTSGNRIESNLMFDVLRQHDIVLTTYHEICRGYPKNDPPIECQTAEQKIEWWKRVYETQRGPLHRMRFHRIVLDEAQAIKNHLSRTSMACRALMAHHKWALSGTPILNSLDELYSYFKFLGVPFTGSFKIFKFNYTDPKDPDSIERLLIRLSQFMIRRDHSDVMMGVPILKLPRASQMTHWTDFNSVERSVYEVVRQRFARRINLSARQGEFEKQYNNVLVMLLRLRQLTAHILMLQFVVQDLLEQEDIEKIREIVQQQATDQRSGKGETIRAIRRQLDHLEAEAKKQSTKKAANHSRNTIPTVAYSDDADDNQRDVEELFDESQNGDTGNDSGRMSAGKTFGKNFDFRPYLDSLTVGENWEKVKRRAQCNSCGGKPIDAWLTSCGHLHCGKCYDDAGLQAAENNRMQITCMGCGSVFTHATQIGRAEVDAMPGRPVTRAKKRYSKEIQRIEQQDIADDWLTYAGPVLPSAKTIALKAQIMNWLTENPQVKIIIYTQFLAMIRIIKKMCDEENWVTEQYHGKMSQNARDQAIKRFADDRNISIMLASLRCGGLGLNLTMASRVVILDPWWNSAAEQQAFCRVFRFGQTQQTFLTRFCVKNTVDERLIDMQERKQKEIDSVMQEDIPARAGKIKTRDMMRLFGNLEMDENGKPYILVDDPDPSVRLHADEEFEDDL